jgi:multiple sugar transport system ATP-binding protein
MNAGNLQQIDAPQTLYDYPVNTFVASFIGSPAMNMIEGELANQNGNLLFQAAGMSMSLPAAFNKLASDSNVSRVVLGVRPEHMEPIKPGSAENLAIDATVEVVEHMGSELYVYLQASREASITARFSAENNFAPGNQIGVKFDQNHLHLFNAENGQAIAHGASSAEPTMSASSA